MAERGADWRDWSWALVVALVLAGLSSWVYARAEARPPEGQVPVGILADPHIVHIGAIYGSFAREAAEGGGLRVHNHQTSEPHPPTLARPWDHLVGRLSMGLGGGAGSAFHFERLAATALFAFGIALLLGELIGSRALRLAGLLALATGGSLYWLEVASPGLLPRAWLDGHFPRQSGLGFAYPALILGAPHLALEVGLFALAFGLALGAERRGSTAWALAAGLATLWLASVRPYTTPVMLVTNGVVLGWPLLRPAQRGAALRRVVAALGPPLPLLLHYAWVLKTGSAFSALDVTHRSPPLFEQALFVGLPFVVALGLCSPRVRAAQEGSAREGSADAAVWRGLAAWGLTNVALCNAYPLVRWEVEAMLPYTLLFVCLALRALAALPGRVRGGVVALFLLLNAVPTVVLAGEVRGKLADPASGYWMPAGERAVLAWLEGQRSPEAFSRDAPEMVLVCDANLGRLVPWLAGVRVFSGHPDHTRDSGAKADAVRRFYRDGSGADALVRGGVTHVLWGPRERSRAAPGFDPGRFGELVKVYEAGGVRLYRYQPD